MAFRGALMMLRRRGSIYGVYQRSMSSNTGDKKILYQPTTAHEMPRSGGIASFMRLPVLKDTKGLDACFVGIPMDIGTSNRSGCRFGPRQIRQESVLLEVANLMTGACPFSSLNIADIGDVPINLYSMEKSCDIITDFYLKIIENGTIPLTMGGDHTLSYPVLRAMKKKYGPIALVHVDAHLDNNEEMFGMKLAHGCPFHRCVDDELLQNDKVYQIGIRGTGYSMDDIRWSREKGFTVIPADKCWHKSLAPLMDEVREKLAGQPVYLSFDIDSLDPGFAPGTGTPEVGGLTPPQGLEIVRGCNGLNLVGCDLVEVSPPYDMAGNTAKIAADILFEMLCVLPGVYYEKTD